ncbi:MAG: FHA domain-containing protein [Anaerolineales bacterium]|nr:FHA domain-containing protein [Anaerolineales bacterium]MCB9146588.1 FHA domain-containing protein [Anaerolineales bacterium]
MIICSNCKHANVTGTMFCVECGAQLIGKDTLVTQSIGTDIPEKTGAREVTEAVEGENAWANLHLLETGQVLPLTVRNEFTMGRISEGQPIMPDIDLSPYQAYAAGVSRLHAVIKRFGLQIIFMDLGSANGSFLNNARLEPNTENTLKHGDVISLGKLRIQVLIEKK